MAARNAGSDLDAAYQAFDLGHFETALGAAESVLQDAPEDRDAWLLKATCLDAMGNTEQALSEYEQLTERYPDDAEIWVRLADLSHHGLGDPEMAIEALNTALDAAEDEEEPDEEMAFEAHLRLVDAHLEMGEMEEALEHANLARQADRDSSDAEGAYAMVLFEMGRVDEAEKSVARAIDKDAQHAASWYLRSLVLERKKDVDGARRAYAKARSLDPDTFPEHVEVGEARLREMAEAEIAEAPEKIRNYLQGVKIVVEDFPADSDLLSKGGTLAPSALVALRGKPLADESDDDPFANKPDALVLYRLNLCRSFEDEDDLHDGLADEIVMEVAAFLDLDPEDLDMEEE